jgi:hypothetical protein
MKTIFTIGGFDLLDQKAVYLFKEMRKVAMPNGAVVALIYDDYSIYKLTGKFPSQSSDHRRKNVSYFADRVIDVISSSAIIDIKEFCSREKFDHNKLVFVAFSDNKNFAQRDLIKELDIPVRFVRPQSNEQTKNNPR